MKSRAVWSLVFHSSIVNGKFVIKKGKLILGLLKSMYMVTSDEPVKMVCSIHNVKSMKVSLRKNDDVLRRISVMSIFQKKFATLFGAYFGKFA